MILADNPFESHAPSHDPVWPGTHVVHGDAPEDYMTSLIGNRSLAFLRNVIEVRMQRRTPLLVLAIPPSP